MATRRQRKGYMSSEKPGADEVAALLNGLTKEREQKARQPSSLEIACGGRLMLVQTPCTIVFKDSDATFVVDDLQAWGWTPFGVLAVGYYDNESSDEADWKSKLFAADTIHNIEFNKERYEQIIEAIREEEEAEEAKEAPADPGEANTEDPDFEGVIVAG